jgi:hypothetical protein
MVQLTSAQFTVLMGIEMRPRNVPNPGTLTGWVFE